MKDLLELRAKIVAELNSAQSHHYYITHISGQYTEEEFVLSSATVGNFQDVLELIDYQLESAIDECNLILDALSNEQRRNIDELIYEH
jgi:hypothetical protein